MKEKSPALDAMERALDEIRDLRRQNEILRAKVEMIDLFAAVLYGSPASRSGGAMHPDPAYLLERAIADLKTSPEPSA